MNTEKIRSDFKQVVDWVQENIADKCPALLEYTKALTYEGQGTGYRVLCPGVLQLKVTGATYKGEDYSVHIEHQWVDADQAVEIASTKCIVNFLLNWKKDKRELCCALADILRKADIIENFKVEDKDKHLE